MSFNTTLDPNHLHQYLLDNSLREDPLLRELREETAQNPHANMQIAPEQGQFMALLVKLMGARRLIEIGTFTGYSSLCMARALPADSYLLCCDIDENWTRIAQGYWERAGVAGKIELKLAPATGTLQTLIDQHRQNTFDLAFIDADKENYDHYYEHCLQLIRPGGLILLDNMLWDGKVADPSIDDADTRAIRALNKKLQSDQRVDFSLVPIADGVGMARKNN